MSGSMHKYDTESKSNEPVCSPCKEGREEEGARMQAREAQPKSGSTTGKNVILMWIIQVEFEAHILKDLWIWKGNLVRTQEKVETKGVGNEESSRKADWQDVEEQLRPSWTHLEKKILLMGV